LARKARGNEYDPVDEINVVTEVDANRVTFGLDEQIQDADIGASNKELIIPLITILSVGLYLATVDEIDREGRVAARTINVIEEELDVPIAFCTVRETE
jgi:hypothetical protein